MLTLTLTTLTLTLTLTLVDTQHESPGTNVSMPTLSRAMTAGVRVQGGVDRGKGYAQGGIYPGVGFEQPVGTPVL